PSGGNGGQCLLTAVHQPTSDQLYVEAAAGRQGPGGGLLEGGVLEGGVLEGGVVLEGGGSLLPTPAAGDAPVERGEPAGVAGGRGVASCLGAVSGLGAAFSTGAPVVTGAAALAGAA